MWAAAIHTAWPDIDGLFACSSTTGREAVTLFTHSAGSFPDLPSFSEPIAHLGLRPYVERAAAEIGFSVI